MPSRRRQFSRSRRPPRAREWLGFTNLDPVGGFPTAAIAMPIVATGQFYANYILSPDEMTSLYDEPTIVRGFVNANFIMPAGGNVGNFGIFYGLIKSDLEAPGGVISNVALPFLPRPWFDPDSAWIWTKYCRFSTVTGFTGLEHQAFGWNHQEAEFKTKRKFQNGEGLLLVIEQYGTAGTGLTIQHNVAGRVLFLNS